MAAHSSILAGILPWTEEPGRLWSMGHTELKITEPSTHTGIVDGKLYPKQPSCSSLTERI